MATGFLFDPRYLNHDTGPGHPECPERLSRSMEHLQTLPWFSKLLKFSPRAAEEEWIAAVHSSAYIKRAKEACSAGNYYLDTPDVGISEESFDTALLAAGGALELADRVVEGRAKNGFALLRPPGHHAEESMALGFCLFNNAAVLARYLQKKHGLDKIAVLDWDVHHGNGTQHLFEQDPSVFYISTHQYPFYPGTGAASEKGSGRGLGATLNCPMPAGAGDEEYRKAFEEKIIPAMNAFRPDAVIISAGFDAHISDPLGNICLSTEFYGWMTEKVMETADKHAKGRIISLLEGGYNLRELPKCIAAHVARLADVQDLNKSI